MDALPAIAYHHIALHLEPRDLRSFRAACRRFRYDAWPGKLHLFPVPGPAMAQTLQRMLAPTPPAADAEDDWNEYAPCVRSLSMSAPRTHASELLAGLSAAGRSLGELRLEACRLTAAEFLALARGCPGLRRLDLEADLVADAEWRTAFRAVPRGLTRLWLSHNSQGVASALSMLGSEEVVASGALRGLRSLHVMSTCARLNLAPIRRLLSGEDGGPRLRELSLMSPDSSRAPLDLLDAQTELRTLALAISNTSVGHIGPVVLRLEALTIDHETFIDCCKLLQGLPELRRLRLTSLDGIWPEALTPAPHLQRVELQCESCANSLSSVLAWAEACNGGCVVVVHHGSAVYFEKASAASVEVLARMLDRGRLLMDLGQAAAPVAGLPLADMPAAQHESMCTLLPRARAVTLDRRLARKLHLGLRAILGDDDDDDDAQDGGGAHGWLLGALEHVRVLGFAATSDSGLYMRLLGPGGTLPRFLAQAGLPALEAVFEVSSDHTADRLAQGGRALLDARPGLTLHVVADCTLPELTGAVGRLRAATAPRRVRLESECWTWYQ